MFLQQVEQVLAVDQFERLAVREVVRRLAIPARCHEDAFGRAFVLHGAEEVADGADADRVLVALRLNDDFAAEDGSDVVGDAVDAAVSGRLGEFRLKAHPREQVGDEAFELARGELHEVRSLVEPGENVGFLDETGIGHVELDDRAHGQQFGWVAGDRRAESLETLGWLDRREVEAGEAISRGPDRDEARVRELAGLSVDRLDVGVEDYGLDDLMRISGEGRADRYEGRLRDERRVQAFSPRGGRAVEVIRLAP